MALFARLGKYLVLVFFSSEWIVASGGPAGSQPFEKVDKHIF
jgi:hypothetical protein